MLILPLITGTAHLLKFAQVSVMDEFIDASVIYSSLVGMPSSGKTPILNIIKKILNKIDELNGVSPFDSHLVNGNLMRIRLKNFYKIF